MMTAHFHIWNFSWNFCQFGSHIFPKITSYKNLGQFFSIGFKNLSGFAEAICKRAKPGPYLEAWRMFEGTKTEF